jgi:CRP/FNR family transcriptional regulator, cyclic AMP receptor protein
MAVPAIPAPALRAASLFDIDPEIAELLDARKRDEGRAHAIVPVAELAAGPWSPLALMGAAARPFGVMVVDGLVLRELVLAGSTATELLGPGDMVSADPPADALLPAEAVWSVPDTARVAIFDDRLLPILRTWPGVGRLLLHRAACRDARLFTHRAIAQLPRVDQRLLTFFAHLSERWGRVAPHGVVMPLHLTHETLGRLIGARRPTVSLALKDLASDQLLERRNDGSWLVRYEVFELFKTDSVVPPSWQPADVRPVPQAAAPDGGLGTGLTMEEVAALTARVDRLRTLHATRLTRSTAVIETSRTLRAARSAR